MQSMLRIFLSSACFLFLPALPAQTLPGEALRQPRGAMFPMERTGGGLHQGDAYSHFSGSRDFEHLTFDTGNNKPLVNMGPQGEIKFLTIYRDSYRGASHPRGWSGVWTGKDSSSYGPYSFRLQFGCADAPVIDFAKVGWDYKTGFLDNVLPVSELTSPARGYTVRLMAYAPVSADGSRRLLGVIYALQLTNHGPGRLRAKVLLPALWEGGQNQNQAKLRWNRFDPFEFEMGLADVGQYSPDVAFDLEKDESV